MEYKIQEETLTAIADAIRQKASTQTQYTPVEMPGAIENIPTGGGGGSTILSGTSNPSNATGADGDIYIQYYVTPDFPEGYTPLKYIEVGSISGPYIDTGLTCSPNISCEISLQLTDIPTNDTWFYGTFINNNSFATVGFYHDRMEGYIGDLSGGGAIQIFDRKIHTYTIDLNGISVDGVLKQTGKWNLVVTTNPIYLFARHGDPKPINNTRIFYCKQWDNSVLVRHFIPAKRNSDNVIGMLDIVNSVFYTNQGSRSFIGQVCTDNEIIDTFLKVNSTWQSLIGSDINDVNTSGSGGGGNPTAGTAVVQGIGAVSHIAGIAQIVEEEL